MVTINLDGTSMADFSFGKYWLEKQFAERSVREMIQYGTIPELESRINFESAESTIRDFNWPRGRDVTVFDVDLNTKTVLQHAIEVGRLDTIQFLLSRGAALKTKDKFGNTPLDTAFKSDRPKIARYLAGLGCRSERYPSVTQHLFTRPSPELIILAIQLDPVGINHYPNRRQIYYSAFYYRKWDSIEILKATEAADTSMRSYLQTGGLPDEMERFFRPLENTRIQTIRTRIYFDISLVELLLREIRLD